MDGTSPQAAFRGGNGLESQPRRGWLGTLPARRCRRIPVPFRLPEPGGLIAPSRCASPTCRTDSGCCDSAAHTSSAIRRIGQDRIGAVIAAEDLAPLSGSVGVVHGKRPVLPQPPASPKMAAACSTCPADNGGSTGVPRTGSRRGLTPAWRKRSAMHWSVRAKSTSHSLPVTSPDRHASKVTNSRYRPPGFLSPRWVSRIWRTSLTMGL